MMRQKLLTCVVLSLGCLLPLQAIADEDGSSVLRGEIASFYKQLALGDFEKVFSHVRDGADGYLPFGVLREISDQPTRQLVIAKYQEAYDAGARIKLAPAYLKVTQHGDVAITTFLVQGTIQQSSDEIPRKTLRRVSLVWTNTDAGWKIVHWHSSRSETDDEDA
jgi:ketosteroid isomerase-like protein